MPSPHNLKPGANSEMNVLAPTIMLQGTASDVGKSILTAALCRIFVQDGWRTVPFKSQNMSLNSYITPDGKEIGRAQGLQADACRVAATTDMNPILLKPKKDMVSQVVVHGKPLRDFEARAYREEYLPIAQKIVQDALNRLRMEAELVVIEGAGSPAEVNLKDRDIVNMRLAGWADAPVLLVADIDRGGVFASIVGTMEILEPHERDRVKGFIINKFRGDVSLLKPGLDWLEQRTGKPVLGVIPYLHNLGLEDEDSASLDSRLAGRTNKTAERASAFHSAGSASSSAAYASNVTLDIAVIRLPRLSNFTDLDPLPQEPDVALRYVTATGQLGQPDAVILPGSKNTVDDLLFLRESGLEALLLQYVEQGGELIGICAGYQMLGTQLHDPDHLESDKDLIQGMGLISAETVFTPDKRTVRISGTAAIPGEADTYHSINGYEIHMGRTSFTEPQRHPFQIARSLPDGTPGEQLHGDGAEAAGGRVWGTYVHGILHNDSFRRSWLNRLRVRKGWAPIEEILDLAGIREAAFNRLAEHVRIHLDMDRIYEMIKPSPTQTGGWIMKIYTRTGDAGQTGVIGGRVDKDDDRVEAYGTVDELNSFLGQAMSLMEEELYSDMLEDLLQIQHELFDCGSDLALYKKELREYKATSEMSTHLEQLIDKYDAETQDITRFILPGGSQVSGALHICRTVCRRAERRVVTLSRSQEINQAALTYLNRLSDLFFMLARVANRREGVPDVSYARSAEVFRNRK